MNHRKWKAGLSSQAPSSVLSGSLPLLSAIGVEIIVWEGKSQSVYISTGRLQKRDTLPAMERNVQSDVTEIKGEKEIQTT